MLNALRRRGVIGPHTRVVPSGYATTLQLVSADHRYYGFQIAAPKHEWPFYSGPGWHATRVEAASDPVPVATVDFGAGPIDEHVAGAAEVEVDPERPVNAVRLAGRIDLAPGRALGPSHAVNGDKVLPVDVVAGASRVLLQWRFRMGAGLGALALRCQPVEVPAAVV